ncbi:hypothetical protein [Stenotrophomonas sp.]|uniref:hypothetical protein n=1 Tax=Stenotrophomonas sp. TaxID=69392 RepID=UPI0028A648DD|nr:hypothetical protein [Stenotrophomonas sp.]
MMNRESKQLKILAVASAGGHWDQMMKIRDAFDGGEVLYACTSRDHAEKQSLRAYVVIRDYNQDEPLKVAAGLVETFRVVKRFRPDVAISTGAAPGLLCLLWARVFGAKTIWVDSVANSERLSLSGRLAMRFCSTVITQWEHLAGSERPVYLGSVL